MFPAIAGGSSTLNSGCLIDGADVTTAGLGDQRINDFEDVVWHPGAARAVTDAQPKSGTSNNLSSAAVGHLNVGGTKNYTLDSTKTCSYSTNTNNTFEVMNGRVIPARAFITGASSGTTATFTPALPTSNPTGALTFGSRTTAAVLDVVNASKTIKTGSATTNAFTSCDVGRTITMTGIPAGTKISAVTNANTATLDKAATSTQNNKAATIGGQNITVNINQSTSRTVANCTFTTSDATVTCTGSNFDAVDDDGATLSGSRVPAGTVIDSVTSGTVIEMSATALAAPVCGGCGGAANYNILTIGDTDTIPHARYLTGGGTTSGDKTVTAPGGNFSAVDVGLQITGTGMPANAYIASINSATSVEINANATATSAVATLTVGKATSTAPSNGEAVAQIKTVLELRPDLVGGTDSCDADTPEGFVISGTWFNPGAYSLVGATGAAPASSVGQIRYPTAVLSFSAFIEQDGADYDVNLPGIPTNLALCEEDMSTTGDDDFKDVASVFEYAGTSAAQGQVPTGVGMPNSAFVRAIRDDVSGTKTASVESSQFGPVSDTCTLGGGDFDCGK